MTAADLKNIKQMIMEVVEEEINKKIVGKIYTIDDLNKAIKEEREALVETNLEQEITRILNSRGKAESVLDFGSRIHKQLAEKFKEDKPKTIIIDTISKFSQDLLDQYLTIVIDTEQRFLMEGKRWHPSDDVFLEKSLRELTKTMSERFGRSQTAILWRIAHILRDQGIKV